MSSIFQTTLTPRRPVSTLSTGQPSLPRLPIPKLEDTVTRYLKSLEPLYEDVARKERTTIDHVKKERQRIAADFVSSGSLGSKLQSRLQDVDAVSPNNWLNDKIWPRVAYHECRDPLLIHSNWWLLLQDDSNVPEAVRNISYEPTGSTSPWQIRRSAWLVKRFLDYRNMLEKQTMHPDSSRTGIWLRKPAYRFYGLTRIPLPGCDTLTTPFSGKPAFIHVMYREWSYVVQVLDQDGQQVPVAEIESRIIALISDVKQRELNGQVVVPIGRLTADPRDLWAANREHLLTLSPRNRRAMSQIETSLFTLSIDDHTLAPDESSCRPPNLSGHIRNTSCGGDSTNRWFDKSFSLIVESNSRFGVMGEHSPVDALIPSIIADWVVSEPLDPTQFVDDVSSASGWELIYWEEDPHIREQFSDAIRRAKAIIDDSDADVLWFNDYGVDWIKNTGTSHISPDAYIQLALQLAWYKSRGCHTATYETASTRLFLHGRTEAIRTLSVESVAFVRAMTDSSSSHVSRYTHLHAASLAHNSTTRDAMLGRGIDRHLLGLRLQLRSEESSPFFDDPLFVLSQEWKLSTSGLSAGIVSLLQGERFGAPFADGYGINYLTGAELLKFGIESKRSSPLTSTKHFKQMIAESLEEMKVVCLEGMYGNQESKL
ncbi:hypothetical protein BS47DRAFT_1291705 [Hydnum rufescens UP504]|uniref:Choline/carnitine acyltransferase domain-containing protein n=1 Tax=Hydnum rufescens UP504 TaxID=1448309 RepID=A0A9P6DZS1_9AGAM|nr:hypothetical protein BS47DRAFT_1291705 [Hydnum rufescens UP504]